MSMTITLKPALFRGDWDQARSQYSLLWFLEAMCRVNQSHIRQFKNLAERGLKKPYPRVYKSGVHYERERGTEEWLDIPQILAGGSYPGVYPGPWDDCEGLACWRVAELRELPFYWKVRRRDRKTGKPYIATVDPAFPPPRGAVKVEGGMPAKPFAKFKRRPDGSFAYHALVLLPDGRLEDPSLTMGMTWEQEFHDRDLANKYKTGQLPVQIRYTDAPETVVLDPESPTGYSAKIEEARRATGLAGDHDHLEPGRNEGDVTNESPDEMIAEWASLEGETHHEDIGDLIARDKVGMRLPRRGRTGRIGRPNQAWSERYHAPLAVPAAGCPPLSNAEIARIGRRRKI